MTAVRRTADAAPTPRAQALLQQEQRLEPDFFAQKVKERRRTIRRLLQDLRATGKRIAAYGAAGRATVLLNYCRLGPELLEFVVDMSPLRYGRSVPGVRVPIVPPQALGDRPPDYLLLTAWNYEAEVVAKEQEFLQRGGRLIVPLPDVRIVGSC